MIRLQDTVLPKFNSQVALITEHQNQAESSTQTQAGLYQLGIPSKDEQLC